MAAKVVVDTNVVLQDKTMRTQIVRGTVALSGNYGTSTSHGDTLSFAGQPLIQSSSIPLRVFIYEQAAAGSATSGYSATYQKGTTIANGAVNFTIGASEYSEGSAYSGAISTTTWRFEAVLPVFV